MSKSLQSLSRPLAAPSGSALRQVAAASLRQASRVLARLARQLAASPAVSLAARQARAQARPLPALEFYAEAGAPEGALYLDGELVGHLPGVTRL